MNNKYYTPKAKGTKQTPIYLPWLLVCSLSFIIIMVLISQWLIKNEPFDESDTQLIELELPSFESEESVDPQENLGAENEEVQEKWHTITIQKGDTLEKIFQNLNVSVSLPAILSLNQDTRQLKSLTPEKEISILLKNNQLKQLIFPLNARQLLEITSDGKIYRSKTVQKQIETRVRYAQATITHSLYLDAKRANISLKLVRQLTRVLSAEIDFAKDLRPGDKFSILYEEQYADGEKISADQILAMSFTNQGETYSAIRFTNSQKQTDYYTPDGNSLKKALLRFPTKFTHISSSFSLRRSHPILRTIRPHRGVDFAAVLGSPITAAGNGQLVQIGENATYGKFIKIKHNTTYTTLYAHMLRFNKGLRAGVHVKQGQVIGFIGQSGLAAGAHLHYELHKNNKPINPMTAHLPLATPLDTATMKKFRKHSENLLAQMKLRELSELATKKK